MAVTCLKISHTRITTLPTHKPVSKKKKTGGFYLKQAEIQILPGELYFSLYLTDMKEYKIKLSLKNLDQLCSGS